jgi:hypothetical protein
VSTIVSTEFFILTNDIYQRHRTGTRAEDDHYVVGEGDMSVNCLVISTNVEMLTVVHKKNLGANITDHGHGWTNCVEGPDERISRSRR